MLNFLFWNVRKNSRAEEREPTKSAVRADRIITAIANLARDHRIDVIVLAECAWSSVNLMNALKSATGKNYAEAKADQCTKIKIFTRFSSDYCLSIPEAGDERFTVRHLSLPGKKSLLLIAAHFEAQGPKRKPMDQLAYLSRDVAPNISFVEETLKHSRTLLIGDLNLNPYDEGITSMYALHAVMTRRLAKKDRDKARKSYKRFYNPSWKFFYSGDDRAPAGTFYFDSGPSSHFWNIFDQVLVRPDLLPDFKDSDLHVLVKAGEETLISRENIPRRDDFSDHLPILCRIALKEETDAE